MNRFSDATLNLYTNNVRFGEWRMMSVLLVSYQQNSILSEGNSWFFFALHEGVWEAEIHVHLFTTLAVNGCESSASPPAGLLPEKEVPIE